METAEVIEIIWTARLPSISRTRLHSNTSSATIQAHVLEGRNHGLYINTFVPRGDDDAAPFPGRYLFGAFPSSLPGVSATSSRARYIGWALLFIWCSQHPTVFDSRIEGPVSSRGRGSGHFSSFRGHILSSNFVSLYTFDSYDLAYLTSGSRLGQEA
jgi:hypothetical protein